MPKKAPTFTDKHAATFLERGFKALMERNYGEANDCANFVLKYMPELAQAHFLVGLLALETGDWGVARKAFSTVVTFKDDHAAAWAQLARVLVKTGNFNNAESALKKAVKHGSEDPLVQEVMGTVYSLMGDQVRALECFDKSCEKTDDPGFEMNRAKTLLFLGKFDETRASLETVLAKQPTNAFAHFTMSRLETVHDTKHIEQMLELLSKFQPYSPPTANLYYGLGKEYEDLEMWPEAYKAYEDGAKARRASIDYNEADEIEAFKALTETFTKEWLESAGDGADTNAPIFIIGQPRTGTTLVERILTARDDVHSAGELPQFGMNLKRMCETKHSNMITAETVRAAAKIDIKELGDVYMESTRSLRSDLPHFVDKLPLNYLYAPLIAAALPGAKIIHVTRDPMDSCFSSYKQLFAEAYYHSYDQGEMARHHMRYRKLMEHYRPVLGGRMLDVAYEDVVADMEPQARRMIDFLGLEWQDASLSFHKQKTAVTTASAAQVREKTHSRSVGRWMRYEKELAPMTAIISQG